MIDVNPDANGGHIAGAAGFLVPSINGDGTHGSTLQERVLTTSKYLRNIRNSCVAAFVSHQLTATPDETLNLFEELALIRETASHNVQAYAEARELEVKTPLDSPHIATVREIVVRTSLLMRESLLEVVNVTQTIMKMAALKRSSYVGDLNAILLTLMQVLDEECSHDVDMLKRINKRLHNKFEELGDRGLLEITTRFDDVMNADSDLEMMDGTVPNENA